MFKLKAYILSLGLIFCCISKGSAQSALSQPIEGPWLFLRSDPVLSTENRGSLTGLSFCNRITGLPANQVRTIRLRPGVTKFGPNECPFRFQRAINGIKTIVIEGHPNGTSVLDLRDGAPRCNGIAISIQNDAPNLVARNFTMLGGYNGWAAGSVTLPSSQDISVQRSQFNKAILVAGPGAVACALNMKISGFYYGIAAEDSAVMTINNTRIDYAGDSSVLAFTGARVALSNFESFYPADPMRHLGYGIAAESLNNSPKHVYRAGPAPAFYNQVNCINETLLKDPSTAGLVIPIDYASAASPDFALIFARRSMVTRSADYNSCLVREANRVPRGLRTVVTAVNSFFIGGLAGGAFTNHGADLVCDNCTSVGSRSNTISGIPRFALDIANISRPNVTGPGGVVWGTGFEARSASRMIVGGTSTAFSNLIGFAAYEHSSINASGSRAWDNDYYGYLSTKAGKIDAVGAVAGGNNQFIDFATQDDQSPEQSGINVARARTVRPGTTISPFVLRTGLNSAPFTVVPNTTKTSGFSFNSVVKSICNTAKSSGLFFRVPC